MSKYFITQEIVIEWLCEHFKNIKGSAFVEFQQFDNGLERNNSRGNSALF